MPVHIIHHVHLCLAYAFTTIEGPFLDSQPSFQCLLIVACAPVFALQQLLVASMALGVGIQKEVLSWWPFSLIRFPPTWSLGMLSLCLAYDGTSE